MSYPCRLIEHQGRGYIERKPGDMWLCPWMIEGLTEKPAWLSQYYWDNVRAIRPPLCVHLPDGNDWLVDSVPSNNPNGGWMITGELPNITAHPSIDSHSVSRDGKLLSKGYHGWLRNGELTDDIEGRVY